MEESLEERKQGISQHTLRNLNITRKWTMFLSIIGAIALGIVIIFGVMAGTFLSIFSSVKTGLGINEWFMFSVLFILLIISLFPVVFLFRFSKHAASAVHHSDMDELDKTIKNLKHFFIYIGIIAIVLMAAYVASLIFTGVTVALPNELG